MIEAKYLYDGSLEMDNLNITDELRKYIRSVQGIELLDENLNIVRNVDPIWDVRRDIFVRNTISTTSDGTNYDMLYENFLYCIRAGDYTNAIKSFRMLVDVNSSITESIINGLKIVILEEIGISTPSLILDIYEIIILYEEIMAETRSKNIFTIQSNIEAITELWPRLSFIVYKMCMAKKSSLIPMIILGLASKYHRKTIDNMESAIVMFQKMMADREFLISREDNVGNVDIYTIKDVFSSNFQIKGTMKSYIGENKYLIDIRGSDNLSREIAEHLGGSRKIIYYFWWSIIVWAESIEDKYNRVHHPIERPISRTSRRREQTGEYKNPVNLRSRGLADVIKKLMILSKKGGVEIYFLLYSILLLFAVESGDMPTEIEDLPSIVDKNDNLYPYLDIPETPMIYYESISYKIRQSKIPKWLYWALSYRRKNIFMLTIDEEAANYDTYFNSQFKKYLI